LRDKFQDFVDANCSVVGISFDSPAENAAFRAKFDFPFALLSDESKEVGAAYGALREPDDNYANFSKRVSYIIDPEGVVRKSYEVSDPAGHAAEALADLAALQR